jgi:hypothetical protein
VLLTSEDHLNYKVSNEGKMQSDVYDVLLNTTGLHWLNVNKFWELFELNQLLEKWNAVAIGHVPFSD